MHESDKRTDQIRADIIAAKQAIDYYEEHSVKDIKNVAAYHLQQAAEKMIKYQIYKSGVSINNSQMFTHNIERLIVYGESLGVALNIPEYIRKNSLKIKKTLQEILPAYHIS